MKKWIRFLPFYLAIIMVSCSEAQQLQVFQKHNYINSLNDSLPYRFFIPDHSGELKLPLILFLHGSGERGSDNEKQVSNGVINFVTTENQKNHPSFVVVPQCPANARWVDVDFRQPFSRQPAEISKPLGMVMALIDSLADQYPVDKQRIYITGLSMGGFGTWDLIERYPAYFAAAVPVCGGGDELLASRLVKIPIWAFHGKQDNVVMPSRSENMINAIRKAGGQPLYTAYPDLGHACWEETYSDPELFQWLFKQTNPLR